MESRFSFCPNVLFHIRIKDTIKSKREGLTENPTAVWEQRHKIKNSKNGALRK